MPSTNTASVVLICDLSGMVIGLILRLTSTQFVQDYVTFNYQLFFNFLLPPIILASGYELHQVRNVESRDEMEGKG